MDNSQVLSTEHNYSFDLVRTISMLAVILFHAAVAYGVRSVAFWPVYDTPNFLGSAILNIFDVFIMPFFFFTAGYFVLPSIRNKTLIGFFVSKFNRLYVYWIIVVLFFLPIGKYFGLQYHHKNVSYLIYWVNSLLDIRNISIGQLGKISYMHFWFISLLFYVFILFAIVYKLCNKLLFKKKVFIEKSYKNTNVSNILFFGILITLCYFIIILFFPGSSWVVIPKILQFKSTHLPVLIIFFSFGVYSRYRGWFIKKDNPFNIYIWICLSLLFTILFFIVGRDFFDNIDISTTLSHRYLLFFSLVRTILILSYLMLTLLLANKYFSTKKEIIKKISDVSFEIYLVHIFFITAFQFLFLQFNMIPIIIKILAVFILGTITSYFFAKYSIYKFPKISAGIFILGFLFMVIFYR